MQRRDLGDQGEELVVNYLQKQKYTILARNYQQKCGEIDIVAQKGNCIFFVEVKMRTTVGSFDLAEVVSFTKQRRLIKTAQFYLVQHRIDESDCQFDVALIEPKNGELALTYLSNAFTQQG